MLMFLILWCLICRESDPVDTLKKWNLATLVDLEAGAVNVSLTMSDNYAQLDVFALVSTTHVLCVCIYVYTCV